MLKIEIDANKISCKNLEFPMPEFIKQGYAFLMDESRFNLDINNPCICLKDSAPEWAQDEFLRMGEDKYQYWTDLFVKEYNVKN